MISVEKHILEDYRQIPARPFVIASFFHYSLLDCIQSTIKIKA